MTVALIHTHRRIGPYIYPSINLSAQGERILYRIIMLW